MDVTNETDILVWRDWGKYTTEAAMYESLAEECVELAKAALKVARVLRKENPTPATLGEAQFAVDEEFTDVISCATALWLEVDEEQSVKKFHRMLQRCSLNKEVDDG